MQRSPLNWKRLPPALAAIAIAAALAQLALAQTGATNTPRQSISPTPAASASATPTSATKRVVYQATLTGVNSGTNANSNSAAGTVTAVVDGTSFGIYVNATGLPANVAHAQAIYSEGTCPTITQDSNGDGYVDQPEAETVAGTPVVPLGFDLASLTPTNIATQFTDVANSPIAAADGSLVYVGSLPLTTLQAALASVATSTPTASPSATATPIDSSSPSSTPSTTPSSGVSPAASPSASPFDIGLENHVIIIHGVSASSSLPATVASASSLPTGETLPVACGKFAILTP